MPRTEAVLLRADARQEQNPTLISRDGATPARLLRPSSPGLGQGPGVRRADRFDAYTENRSVNGS
jgi:hypothetical protein